MVESTPGKLPVQTDYLGRYSRPVLTSSIFERLVLHHIKAYLPPTLDPHHFAYRANRSTEDAIAIALHAAPSHVEHRESYVRMLFIDYSSAFNTIIPAILVSKLSDLKLGPHFTSTLSTHSTAVTPTPVPP